MNVHVLVHPLNYRPRAVIKRTTRRHDNDDDDDDEDDVLRNHRESPLQIIMLAAMAEDGR